MSDIELVELVIKIPKSDYRCIKEIPLSSMFGFDNWELIAQAIANGIPLPNVFQDIKNDMIDRSFMSDIYNDETEEEIIHLNEAFDAMDKYIRDKE